MNLNPFAVSGLLIIITYIPLLILIFSKGKSKAAIIYGLHILCVFLWGVGSFLIGMNKEPNLVNPIWKFSCFGVNLIPVFFYHATLLITKKKNNILLFLIYLQAIVFSILIFSNQMFTQFHQVFNSFFYHYNSRWYLELFIIWELIVLLGHLNLLIHFNQSKNIKKLRTFLIFTGIGFIGGTGNFLPALGIYIYPLGNFLVPLHSFGISYAILKHQFLNIEFEFKKSLSYSILFAFILLLYLTVVVSFEKLVQYYLSYHSYIISILTVFVIGIFLIPIHKRIQIYIDKLFLTKNPIDLIQENELLRQEITQTEKLKSIATFASGMAHEIKNPLTSIKTFCEFLPNKIHDKDFLEKFIPIVSRETDRINELVHDLLEYAKPTLLIFKPDDIHKILEDVLTALSTQIINKNLNILRDFDTTNIPTIPLDDKQIKQALLNILLNAVEVVRFNGTIELTTRLSTDGQTLIVTIRDNGEGIAKEDLTRIFDPFFTKKEKGTGLGLSITHGIIKEHGGKIFVESTVGVGTVFRIELPFNK